MTRGFSMLNCQTIGERMNSVNLFLILLVTCTILVASCKEQGTSAAGVPEIQSVTFSSEEFIVNEATMITASLSAPLGEAYALKWQLSGYQTQSDTTVSQAVLGWKVPRVHGSYEHTVQVVSARGEAVSEVYTFTTEIASVPVEPVEGNKLVFSMQPTGEDRNQIFTMNVDGSELTQLTFFENDNAFDTSWSPDGKQIVFTSSFMSTTSGPTIYLMNADGTNLRPMKPLPNSTIAYGGRNPKWSPDGTKIVFSSLELLVDILIYDFETDSVNRVTNHSADDQHPNWSPDGELVVFASKRDYFDADSMRYRSDLYTIDVNGENLQRLTETGFASRPNWQAGNNFIAYEWSRNGNRIFYLDLSTNQIQELETNLEFEVSPRWSRSKEWLFIRGRIDENANPEVQMYDFSQNPPLLINMYQDIEAFWNGIDFDWYHYEE